MPKLIAQPIIEHFMRSRLFWFGRLGRQDIVRAYDVGTAYASRLVRKVREEVCSTRVGKGEVDPLSKTDLPDGVSSQRFLSDLYNAAVTSSDPTPSCGGEVPFAVIDAFRYNVPETILRPIVMALESQGFLKITYQGMGIGDTPRQRLIEPVRLVHVQGRWHIHAYCHDAKGARDFVLARILDVAPMERRVPADPMLDFEMSAPTPHRFVPHPELSRDQMKVVEREFGMEGGTLELHLTDSELFYFMQQFVASEGERPPFKLLVRSELPSESRQEEPGNAQDE